MLQPREGVDVLYLFEGARKLLPRVPGALADEAREQSRNLLRPKGTQSVVEHELSEKELMAAHGTSHPPCQLHSARLIYITQGSEHLEKDDGCQEPAASPSQQPPSTPASHLYSLVVLWEQQQRLI